MSALVYRWQNNYINKQIR